MSMSYTFDVSNCSGCAKITTRFNPPIQLDENKQYELALDKLESYWSFPNVSESNGYFHITIREESGYSFRIKTGAYELKEINRYIQQTLKDLGAREDIVSFTANRNTLRCIMTIADGCLVNFVDKNTLASLFGFDNKVYEAGVHEAEKIINIININSIVVHNNLVSGSYVDGSLSPVIYSFFPTSGVGEKINEKPLERVYCPVNLKTITETQTWLTDQNDNDIDLQGENLTIRFHIREVANSYLEKMVKLLENMVKLMEKNTNILYK